MTEAEHNRPIPKFFGNRPSASAAEVFGLVEALPTLNSFKFLLPFRRTDVSS